MGRLGGDEFAILMPDTDLDRAAGKNSEALAEARALFAHTAAECVDLSLSEHDEVMAWVLGLSHLVNIARIVRKHDIPARPVSTGTTSAPSSRMRKTFGRCRSTSIAPM